MRNQQVVDRITDPTPSLGETIGLSMICLALLAVLLGLAIGATLAVIGYMIIASLALPLAVIGLGALGRLVHVATAMLEPIVGRDLDGDRYIGPPPQTIEHETIRMIPSNIRHTTQVLSGEEHGFAPDDWAYLVDGLAERGVSWRSWRGVRLPSGTVLATYDDYRAFPDALARLGILTGRSERSAGVLADVDPEHIKRMLGV